MAAFRASAAPSEEQGRLSGGGAHNRPQRVLDEFTAPAEKSVFLERSRGCIERLFGVHLAFLEAAKSGGWAPPGTGGRRIWLSLLGEREEVCSAKVGRREGWGGSLGMSPWKEGDVCRESRSSRHGCPVECRQSSTCNRSLSDRSKLQTISHTYDRHSISTVG